MTTTTTTKERTMRTATQILADLERDVPGFKVLDVVSGFTPNQGWNLDIILAAGLRTPIDTGSAGVLTVAQRSWPAGTDEDGVVAGTIPAAEVTLTSDGRHYARHLGWHEGPTADVVYVERFTADGRVFHGFIDSESRRLVQAG